jgi:hypothetical protein
MATQFATRNASANDQQMRERIEQLLGSPGGPELLAAELDELCGQQPDSAFQFLALIDQHFRRGRLAAPQYKSLKAQATDLALGRRPARATTKAVPARSPVPTPAPSVTTTAHAPATAVAPVNAVAASAVAPTVVAPPAAAVAAPTTTSASAPAEAPSTFTLLRELLGCEPLRQSRAPVISAEVARRRRMARRRLKFSGSPFTPYTGGWR